MSALLQLFNQGTPRIAILGAGGMGKTSLARAVVHHPDIKVKYEQHRHFVGCDSAQNKVELTALIGAHLGLKPGHDLTSTIVEHFSSSPSSLLILDNLEQLWEPAETRRDIEEFLSLLTDVGHLALLVGTYSFHVLCYIDSLLDYNARGRKASKSPLDSAIFTAFEAFEPRCGSTDIY